MKTITLLFVVSVVAFAQNAPDSSGILDRIANDT